MVEMVEVVDNVCNMFLYVPDGFLQDSKKCVTKLRENVVMFLLAS